MRLAFGDSRIQILVCRCTAGFAVAVGLAVLFDGRLLADDLAPTADTAGTAGATASESTASDTTVPDSTADGATPVNAGQSDLDEAIRLRVTAQSMGDLERIIELSESSLQKGLDKETEILARQMVAASLLQHATRLSQDLLQSRNAVDAAAHLHRFALKDLEKAATYDDELGEVYLLMAKLKAMDRNTIPQAIEAAEKAIQRFPQPDQKLELASALVLRATLIDDKEKSLADLSRAIELHPQNQQAWRARGLLYAQDNKIEEALRDFEELLKIDASDVITLQQVAQLFEKKEDHQRALEYIDKAIKIAPKSPGTYFLRAQIRISQKQVDLALEDLNHVIEFVPSENRPNFLLTKARVCLQQDVPDVPEEAARKYHQLAVDDLTKVLGIKPGDEDALILRSIAYGNLKKLGTAIVDLRALVQLYPEKPEYQLQLAAFLIRDERPRKAIEVYDKLLEKDQSLDRARLGRADALLSVGEHARAIAEYEMLLAKEPADVLGSILNNFAWVLATSPDEHLRNGKRSVELALRACELTEYKQPHILSTLAAGYAESKDFEQAKHWSQKAVELGQEHQDLAQLKSELESYQREQPWREKELVNEKQEPELPAGVDLESIGDSRDQQSEESDLLNVPGEEAPEAEKSDEADSDEP